MRDSLAELADRYAVERELGRGGMASVWLARDLRHDRPVAIKVLHPELAGAIGVDRFVREIRLTARLQHPNIVPVLDSGTVAGPGGITLPWYAMAYMAGESLRARLDRERQLPIEDALRITEETAGALAAAHRDGVIHRDIKPENLLLAGGRTYVADFGIAKALVETGGERLTSTGLAIGTPAYMSPEQATADAVDARTDQYSLATVLYEMLAGEPPFTGPTAQAIMARRMSGPPRPIRPVRPSVPEAVEAALLCALEAAPADRFPDVAAFASALRSGTTGARGAPTPARRVTHPGRIVSGAVLVAAIAVAGWLFAQRRHEARATPDPDVVALYQRGLQGYDRRTPAGASDAIQSLTAAIRRDSTYAPAWAALAKVYQQAYGRRFVFPGVARDSVLQLAVAAAARALFLDRRSADAWLTQAMVSRAVDPTDETPVIASLRQALTIDSTNAKAWHVLATSLANRGDMTAALTAWRRSVAANPSYTEGVAFLGLGHYWRRQYDSAAHWTDSAIALDPTFLLGRHSAGLVAVERGNFARGRAAFEAARRVSTDVEVLNALAGTALVDARSGERDEARRTLQRADSLATAYVPIPLHTAVYLAEGHAAFGDLQAAIALLRRYSPRDDTHFQLHLRCDPPLDPLAGDPRFRALLLTPRPPPGSGC